MEVNPEIPIKSYKYQFCDNIIGNGVWDILSQ